MIALNTSEAAFLLLRALISGAVLGAAYDLIRFLRSLFSPEKKSGGARLMRVLHFLLVLLTDIIFWLTVGIVSIALGYEYVSGAFRGMIYLGLALGAIAYYFTLGRAVLALSKILVKLLRGLFPRVIKLMTVPLSFISKGIISLYHLTICKIIGRIINRISLARSARKNTPVSAPDTVSEAKDGGREEDFVYVEGKKGYRRSDRIDFGAYRRGDR